MYDSILRGAHKIRYVLHAAINFININGATCPKEARLQIKFINCIKTKSYARMHDLIENLRLYDDT